MRSLLSISILAFAAAFTAPALAGAPARPAPPHPPAPSKPSPVKLGLEFVYKPTAVGSVVSVVDTLVNDMIIEAGGNKLPHHGTTDKKYTIKALEAKDQVTKVEVTYASVTEEQSTAGKTAKKTLPHSGKTYWVSVAGAGKLLVTTPKGEKVSDEESTEVTKDFDDDLGTTPKMVRVIVSKTWTPKTKVALSAADLAILNEGEDKPIGTAGSITLLSSTKKISVFKVELAANLKTAVVDLQLPTLVLEATVDTASLRPLTLKMSGAIKGTAQGMPVSGTLVGTKTSKLK